MSENIYRQYDESCIYSHQYLNHVDRMTRENLHSKSDIAAELAARDIRIAELEAQITEARKSSAPQTADINMANAGMREWDKQHKLGERHWPTMLIAVYNAMTLAGGSE